MANGPGGVLTSPRRAATIAAVNEFSEVMMAQLLAVLSAVCFVLGGLSLGIGVTLAKIRRANEQMSASLLTVVRQDAVA
jgi:hypothetical protein